MVVEEEPEPKHYLAITGAAGLGVGWIVQENAKHMEGNTRADTWPRAGQKYNSLSATLTVYRESVAGWGHVMFMLKAAQAQKHATPLESSDPDGQEPQPTVCAANTHTLRMLQSS